MGRPITEEHKRRISEAHAGKPLTAEHRKKLRDAKLGKPGPWTGKKRGPMSTEWKAKIKASMQGMKRDPAAAAKTGAALRGRKRADIVGDLNHQWGKAPTRHRNFLYKDVRMRSSYEIRFAAMMDKAGIEWEYEKARFDLGSCTYLPDFYVPSTGVYWETKGWFATRDQDKVRMFREKYPDVPLIVATKPILTMMEKCYGC